MKITAVTPFHISVPYDFGNSAENAAATQWQRMETLFVKVTTDEGLTGWGEGFGLAACGITKTAVERAIAPLAIGRDPTDIAALVADIAYKQRNCSRNGPVGFALSVLDIALWDIAGKRTACRSIGSSAARKRSSACRPMRACCVTAMPTSCGATAPRPSAEGYTSVKLHETGVAQITAAREAIGPDIALTVDASCAWTVPQAIDTAQAIAALPAAMARKGAMAAGGL